MRKLAALGKWLNELRAYCASLNPMPSHNIQVAHTAIGTSYIGTAEGPAQEAPAGMHFEGEWRDQSYTKGAVVVIRAGISAGTYVAVTDVPAGTAAPTDPTTGTFWVSLARGNVLGTFY